MSQFPNSWEEITLGDILDRFQYGFTAKANPSAEGVRFLRITDIENGAVKWEQVPGLVEEIKGDKYTLYDGDFVFARSGSVEKASRIENPPDAIFASYLIRGTPLLSDLSDWLAWFIKSNLYLQQIFDKAVGIGLSNINAKKLATIEIPIAPLAEQRRIVAKLDALFARTRQAREELEHIPALIGHYKEAILAAAFRGELTADWRKNYQQTDLPDVEANQDINGDKAFEAPFTIPTGWKWMPLPKLGKLGRGKSRHRPRNEPSLYGGPYPFVQTGEIRSADGFLATYTKTYSEIGLAQSKLWPVGTVCITIAANIAETAILGIEACFPDSVVGLITDDTICLNRYAEYFLRTIREELDAFAPATAQKNINLGTLSEVYMPLPPREEQDEIVRLVDELYDSISTISLDAEQAYRMLDYLERAVLAKAFRGELVSQDPDDEPASVLLERIRAARAEQSNGSRRQKRK